MMTARALHAASAVFAAMFSLTTLLATTLQRQARPWPRLSRPATAVRGSPPGSSMRLPELSSHPGR